MILWQIVVLLAAASYTIDRTLSRDEVVQHFRIGVTAFSNEAPRIRREAICGLAKMDQMGLLSISQYQEEKLKRCLIKNTLDFFYQYVVS